VTELPEVKINSKTFDKHTCVHELVEILDNGIILNGQSEMKLKCEELSLANVRDSAIKVRADVRAYMQQKYEGTPFTFMTDRQLRNLVHQTRTAEFKEWEGATLSHPLIHCGEDDERNFLQF
jgi:hypothetical protein